MSLLLLWGLLLHGTGAYATNAVQQLTAHPTGTPHPELLNSDDSILELQQGMLYLVQEGTAPTLTFSVQQSVAITKACAFRFPSTQAIAPYAARAPGDNFFCQFYYTTSQPQAP